MVLDKLELHLAMDLGNELIDLGQYLNESKVKFRTVISGGHSVFDGEPMFEFIKKAYFN